jgi:hypothetical protein
MEIVLIIIGVFIAIIFFTAGSKLSKRTKIVRKVFSELATSIEAGSKDSELRENSKEVGLAIVFGNEAKDKILDEIKRKGLALAEEKNSVWISGDHTLVAVNHEIDRLEKVIKQRCEKIMSAAN